jgi:hypothetical protein
MSDYVVEFKLSMPGRSSWDGRWSGEGKNYVIRRELSHDALARLFDAPSGVDLTACRRIWTHRWSDGWLAQIAARVVPAGEDLPKSDGFCGYDWMVENILRTGSPYSAVTS